MGHRYGLSNPDETFVAHSYPEHRIDLGEVTMNYSVAGGPALPALLLIPGQTESWWGYEKAMDLLQERFHCFAVDLRGQGRSSRTPGRYTLDNIGNDVVRFIMIIIKRPAIVSGLSSGGLLAAWLAAYGLPDLIRGALCEDPPFFSSEVNTSCGHSLRQATGPLFQLLSKYLGDQWTIGDWEGLKAASRRDLPSWLTAMRDRIIPYTNKPPQELKEYDPEWGRATFTGTLGASCDHTQMLAAVKAPILYTHHFRSVDAESGALMGAASDQQAAYACRLMRSAGQRIDYQSFPTMGHRMHSLEPQLFAQTLVDWAATL